MKRMINVFVYMLIAGPAFGASDVRDAVDPTITEPNPAVAILKKTDAATKSVTSVRYRAEFYGTGWLAERLPTIEGTAAISGRHDQHFLNARFDATVRYAFGDGAHKLTYVADGSTFTLIDWDNKATYSNSDPNVTGHGGRAAERLGVREFVVAEPFSDEINAEFVKLLPNELVGKEWCHVIDVVYGQKRGHAVWFVSTRDFLPRRVDRIFENPRRGQATMQTILTHLSFEPEILPEEMQVVVPGEFEALDYFAPDVRRMPS